MVIFNSYVSLPEGISVYTDIWPFQLHLISVSLQGKKINRSVPFAICLRKNQNWHLQAVTSHHIHIRIIITTIIINTKSHKSIKQHSYIELLNTYQISYINYHHHYHYQHISHVHLLKISLAKISGLPDFSIP